jgi:hypothetical protein
VSADEIVRALRLQPHPKEKGFFRETYRSEHSTAIYFLLTSDGFSEMHCLRSDEILHFYAGSPADMLQLYEDGSGKVIRLGSNLALGEQPQIVVPRGTWQGMRTAGDFTFFGCTVAPPFQYTDYESGDRTELIARYSQFKDLITLLTNP